MNKEQSQISFTKDIIKEVAEEMGVSERKVKGVYDSMILYLKYLTRETDAVAIFIPNLGTLHVKVGYVLKRLEKATKSNNKKILDIFGRKKEKIDKHVKVLIENNYMKKSRHFQKNMINMFAYNDGKTITEIEEKQNNK